MQIEQSHLKNAACRELLKALNIITLACIVDLLETSKFLTFTGNISEPSR
jgi:hypothetical protein